MKGLPFELLFILFFGALLLYNFIKQRAAELRPPEPKQDEPEPDDIPESVWGRGSQDLTTRTDPAAPVLMAPPRMSAAADTAAPADRRRRFDRQALLGSRRRVQDAFVVATILGRCRADEPHEER